MVFALPFALFSFTLALHETTIPFTWQKLLFVILCMIFARNAAMGFNRYADRKFDAKNDRTKNREVPAGKISAKSALAFVIVNCVLFIATTFFINKLCFFLSPVALLVILGYSLTKRFTFLCHLILGIGLSIGTAGAYIAVTNDLSFTACLLSLVVILWVSGFDIIYALNDKDFDQNEKLFSIPAQFGIKGALLFSSILHLLCLASVVLIAFLIPLQTLGWIGTSVFIAMLIVQHLLVSPKNLTRVNAAFATTNGFASVFYGLFCILDLVLK